MAPTTTGKASLTERVPSPTRWVRWAVVVLEDWVSTEDRVPREKPGARNRDSY